MGEKEKEKEKNLYAPMKPKKFYSPSWTAEELEGGVNSWSLESCRSVMHRWAERTELSTIWTIRRWSVSAGLSTCTVHAVWKKGSCFHVSIFSIYIYFSFFWGGGKGRWEGNICCLGLLEVAIGMYAFFFSQWCHYWRFHHTVFVHSAVTAVLEKSGCGRSGHRKRSWLKVCQLTRD